MTLQEIVNMVMFMFPRAESYEPSFIISIVDKRQKIIYRTMYKPETATTYDILAGNPFYPISFSPENIIDVVVGGKEYPFQNVKYDAQSRYYYITEDSSIGIYPTPAEDISDGLTVFRYKEPRTLGGLNDVPELDSAWHMMLVYHACRELAAMSERNDMVSVFMNEINQLERQFNRSKQARPHRIEDVYGVGRGVT